MFNKKEKTYTLTQSEYNKVQDLFDKQKQEIEQLKAELNKSSLYRKIGQLESDNDDLSRVINQLHQEKQALSNTLKKERSTMSLVLQKLDEVNKLCSSSIGKSYRDNQLNVKAVDFIINSRV